MRRPVTSAAAPAVLALLLSLAGCGVAPCPSGKTACAGSCIDLQTDAGHCGQCLTLCPASATCVGGTCHCPTGTTQCGDACVNLLSDANNCGACGQKCGLGTCQDVGGSGTCVCDASPAMVTQCPGRNPECVDLATDRTSCGSCGYDCAQHGFVNGICNAGNCACASPLPDLCGGVCVNRLTDPTNCGSCGYVCAQHGFVNGICNTGSCACASGDTHCASAGGYCADLTTDASNCGGCGNACATSATCTASACVCPTSAPTVCSGACVNLQTDAKHCGTCSVACGAGNFCGSGICCANGNVVCGTSATATCCAGSACCGTGASAGCETPHSNGVGQSFFDCVPLGTYDLAQAQSAAAAWAAGADTPGYPCNDSTCLFRQSATQAAIWCYQGSLAGRVYLNALGVSPVCPGLTSATWN